MDKPENCISVAKAKAMEASWEATRGEVLQKALGYPDTHHTIYSIKQIRDYLDYVEHKSLEQHILEPKISIFLGVYEKTENRPPVSTFFLAPIKPVQIDGVVKDLPNYEIDPYNLGEVPWPPDKYGTE